MMKELTLIGGGVGPGKKGTLPQRLISSPNGWKTSSQPRFTSKFIVKYPAENHSAISVDVNGP